MASVSDYILAFNRGILSRLAIARADVKRVAMTAKEMMNWLPATLGPMRFRPGTKYIGATAVATGYVKSIPFIFSLRDTAIIEITDELMRVWVDDVLITRPSVSTAVTNGNFDTNLTGWTDADEGADAVSEWITGGYMRLTGSGETNGAIRTQTLTVAGGDQNVEHALRILVVYGKLIIRVGSTATLDDYITETALGPGEHSLAFTPTGANVYISLINRETYPVYLNSINIEAAGVMSFATALLPTESLDDVRYVQSGDIIYIARGTSRKPVAIERRTTRSWSLVDYHPDTGPFLPANVTITTMTADAVSATAADPIVTITASKGYFKSTDVGGLIRLTSVGQTVSASLGSLNASTDEIRVTGIGDDRIFTISLTGTWVGTVTLERSVGEPGSWTAVTTYTANTTTTYNDLLDNQIIYYRLTMTAYTSGSATAVLSIPSGAITGIGRIITYTSPTAVDVFVIKDFGNTSATDDWAMGSWSDRRGFPSAVAFWGGRLMWGGKDRIWGSVTDDYYNFDPDYEGDAGPLNRSIGYGPVDTINWLLPLNQLVVGAEGAEHFCRSNGFDEPLTPSNFNIREGTTYGSAPAEPVKIDTAGVFADRSGERVMECVATSEGGIQTAELSVLCPELCHPKIVRIAVQRRPETRVHLLRCDGTVVIMTYDKLEELKCFSTWETEGLVEDICIIPALNEADDLVYYTVSRIVGGVIVRYREKWAKQSETTGGVTTKLADSYVEYDGVSTTTITGLSHLEGKSVVAWANSKDQGIFTVVSGSITLPEATTYAIVGLSYYADFISNKLGFNLYGAQGLSKQTRVKHLGLLLQDTDANGLQFGTDVDNLDVLPPVEMEAVVVADYLWEEFDNDPVPVNGTFSFDTRVVLRATAPRPCTVKAVVVQLEHQR